MQEELPDNVIWLVDGDEGRYVHKYEFQPFQVGDTATFYSYHADGTFDYDSAVTCRIEKDDTLGDVARLI